MLVIIIIVLLDQFIMALLQISEPEISTSSLYTNKLAVGIDLGTTNSLIAIVRNNIPEVLCDKEEHSLLPSIVRYLSNGYVDIGYKAKNAQIHDPKNTITSIKRFMGRHLKDMNYIENMPYDFQNTQEEGIIRFKTIAGMKSPIEISAQILIGLRQRAENILGSNKLAGAVITVPAYFDDAQRQATKDAAKLAGINVLRLLNEPTAAAIAYGLDNHLEGIFAVYDLGGGTFDISILKLTKRVFEVLSTGGNSILGGDDFDYQLFCWVCEQSKLSLLSNEDTCFLMEKVREAKELLSFKKVVQINTILHSNKTINVSLTAEKFQKLTENLIFKTIKACRKVLHDAELTPTDIDGIVLVGGATRMPHVRNAISSFFKKLPLIDVDPDKVVALGAAIQANLLIGNHSNRDNLLLLDVIPLSLCIETVGGLVEKIISRNSTIPCANTQEFTTFKNNQTAILIHVLQGERELVVHCRSLARFELHGIPPNPAGFARIRVTYQVDADGLLSVSAREIISGVETGITIRPSYGLTDTEIIRMLEESHKLADIDTKHRILRDTQLEAERIIFIAESALITDSILLNEEERITIKLLLDNLRNTINDKNHFAMKVAIDALVNGTKSFSERRIEYSINTASNETQNLDKI